MMKMAGFVEIKKKNRRGKMRKIMRKEGNTINEERS